MILHIANDRSGAAADGSATAGGGPLVAADAGAGGNVRPKRRQPDLLRSGLGSGSPLAGRSLAVGCPSLGLEASHRADHAGGAGRDDGAAVAGVTAGRA